MYELNCRTGKLLWIHKPYFKRFKGPILCCFSSISHSYQRSNITVFQMNGPKPICGPKFLLAVAQVSSTESRLFLCLHLWMPMNSICQNLPCLLLVPLRETVPLKLAVACANVMVDIYKCITMARQDAVVQPYQFDPESIEAQSALYWPSLLKQSDVKWLAHIDKLTRTAAGTLSLKMKRSHCLFCCPVAGTEYRHWCWFLQPTTE